jgi:fumarate reductase subunit C
MRTRPYVRSMDSWWTRDPFFIAYMAREATALVVAAYALVLLVGLVRLSQGEAAWTGWLTALQSPWSVAVHIFILACFAYHTWSWFRIMPKTMPAIFVGGKALPAAAITAAGLAAAALCTVVVLWLAGAKS